MTIKNKHDLQKTIDIAKEFVQRADDLIGEIEQGEISRYGPSPSASAVKRQSMELTRQLAILRRI